LEALEDRTLLDVSAVSLAAAGGTAAGVSGIPENEPPSNGPLHQTLHAISDDGRYLVYSSTAANLVAGQVDTNGGDDVLLFDRVAHTNTLVSHTPGSATTAANGASRYAVISADGNWVAFVSRATNLVPGLAKHNNGADVFLFQRATGAVSLVSHASSSMTTTGDGVSGDLLGPPVEALAGGLSVSGDGRFVAFSSAATDLAPLAPNHGVSNVFLYDRQGGTVTLVSHPVAGSFESSQNPALSRDGRYVAFTSDATHMLPGQVDTSGTSNVFLYEVATGALTLVSHVPGSAVTTGNNFSRSPALSDDGSFVAFESGATDLVGDPLHDINGGGILGVDVFLYSRQSGAVTLVSHTPGQATTTGNQASWTGAISGDGNRVAFQSWASNLVAGQNETQFGYQVFLYDRQGGGAVSLVSHTPANFTTTGNNDSEYPVLSGDGRYVAFSSVAGNLVTGQSGSTRNVFRYDRVTGTALLASHTPGSSTAVGNSDSDVPVLSADGQYVAFDSVATNLVAGDANGAQDVFLFTPAANQAATFDLAPVRGGDTGQVSVVLSGIAFAAGVDVRLRRAGQPDVVATAVRVRSGGFALDAVFDLTGKADGAWDVVVTNPGAASVTRPGAFTIEPGQAPQIWVGFAGRTNIKGGVPQSLTFVYGNRGNDDAFGVPVWVGGIPDNTTLTPDFPIAPPPGPAGAPPYDWNQIPDVDLPEPGGTTAQGYFIPDIPAGATVTLEFTVVAPAGSTLDLHSWYNPPVSDAAPPQSLSDPGLQRCAACLTAVAGTMLNILGYTPGLDTADKTLMYFAGLGLNIYGAQLPQANVPQSVFKMALSTGGFVLGLLDKAPGLAQVIKAVKGAWGLYDVFKKCKEFGDKEGETDRTYHPGSPHDPNEKIGPDGVGTGRFVSGAQPLAYTVAFENVATATAPAQDVVITDQLDTADLDLSTFSFGPISFGAHTVVPPPGLTNYSTDVDLRPANNLIVHISAVLDTGSGMLTWSFTSLDPATGQPTKEPNAGFLPPDTTPPQGEGSVLYSVMPRGGLATGTQIRDRARIVFDVNPPINTAEWVNTIDNDAPVSHVLPLPATVAAAFPVQWSGTDAGSGILDYTVYVSDNGGPFTVWQLNTTATSGTFTGQVGHRYAFYSVAEDRTFNHQAVPATADTSTTVVPAQTVGSFDPATATWYLRNSASAGAPDAGAFQYGGPGWLPVVGDWDGNGSVTVGVVDPATATWYLRNSNSPGAPDVGSFQYGLPGWIPVAGDWNHSGHTGIGMFDPSSGKWYLRNSASAGAPDAGVFAYGGNGWVPVVGDWTGSGRSTVGVVNPGTMTWYLRNSNSSGAPDFLPFAYGGAGWAPVVGDWDGNGTSTVGVVSPQGIWYLRNSNSSGAPDFSPFPYGLGVWKPVAGVWNFPVQPMRALGAPQSAGAGSTLEAGSLQDIVATALTRLESAGVDPSVVQLLAGASYEVAALPAGVLALTHVRSQEVLVSPNAAGYGWFVDTTPLGDEEFSASAPGSSLTALPDGAAAGREDLLTVVLHEMGHLAGLSDVGGSAADNGLMAEFLPSGLRCTQALDQVFAAGLT
jgi:Tol biopolymer transport system component